MCYRLDEVKAYANKVEAMATYFHQINDDEMEQIAVRIKARAYRRLGEILATYKSKGGRPEKADVGCGTSFNDNADEDEDEPITQRQAAEKAGLSKRQEVTAARAAKIPEETFEAEVERPRRPPTVTELAEIGKKPRGLPPQGRVFSNYCS